MSTFAAVSCTSTGVSRHVLRPFLKRRRRLGDPRSTILDSVRSTRKGTTTSLHQQSRASTTARSAEDQPLVSLRNARLSYRPEDTSEAHVSQPISLDIWHPSRGGHLLLGRNGTGKSLITQTLATNGTGTLVDGEYVVTAPQWHSRAVTHVTFRSHQDVLQTSAHLTSYKVIAEGGQVSKAAQFLIVRFGLYPLLHREISTLSTGEIRKVLLVRALATRPRLLILDNAFDGLDVASRENLLDLVRQTLRGFKQDILVQGIDAKNAARTQICLVTQRPEEVADEFTNVAFLDPPHTDRVSPETSAQGGDLRTMVRNGQSATQIFAQSLGTTSPLEEGDLDDSPWDSRKDEYWNAPGLPTLTEMSIWWNHGRKDDDDGTSSTNTTLPLVDAQGLRIQKGSTVVLQELDWKVWPSQHWLVAGGNGAGKSTLSRLLAYCETDSDTEGYLRVLHGKRNLPQIDIDDDQQTVVGSQFVHRRPGVGWVSTESHLQRVHDQRTAREILLEEASSDSYIVQTVTEWFNLTHDPKLLEQHFADLSQGQQKLVLLAAAISSRPRILVLDEPCQGLDIVHRRLLLGLVERLCQATDTNDTDTSSRSMTLIYITHHMEEVLPSINQVVHLKDGQAVYQGSRKLYNPDLL
jgi:molybdate transport system ATP-binding protein